jgi:hypothetical protein
MSFSPIIPNSQKTGKPWEDATALLWEEGNFRYRVLQWGLRLGCADLRRVVEGKRH